MSVSFPGGGKEGMKKEDFRNILVAGGGFGSGPRKWNFVLNSDLCEVFETHYRNTART